MMSTIEGSAKLAPIFDFKANKVKDKINGKRSDNKRKRNKKSPKRTVAEKRTKNKPDISFNDNSAETEADCRRSKRLKSKVSENESKVSYCEDTDEEAVFEDKFETPEEVVDKLNESVILLEENSDTIDYWSDHKTEQCLQSDSNDEDILIIESNVCTNSQSSQETVRSSSSQTGEQRTECLLWTEKYKPVNSAEMVGHEVAVNRIKTWLEDWGKSDTKRVANIEDSEDSNDCLDNSNTCLLICGPTGCGKTSMVYAIAEELKYEVLELNASMKRNGRIISKILGEATQSHHMQRNVDSNGSTPSIHSFFSSVANNKVDNDIKFIKQKKKKKPKGILNYFSKQTQSSDEKPSKSRDIKVIENKCLNKTDIQSERDSVPQTTDKSSNESQFVPKALSIASKSFILFDDIDVMVEDDFVGFWSAFNRINEITKKPVILTATQYVPYIKENVHRLQVLSICKPSASDTISGLKRIYDKELDGSDSNVSEEVYKYLSETYDNDIRRCVNQMQFGTEWQQIDSQTNISSDKKFDVNSYYDSLLFADVMRTQFRIQTYSQNRDNWMKCKPTFIENENQSICLAKDIVESVNDLNYPNVTKRIKLKQLSKPIDRETIESISQYLTPNLSLRTILMDFCPFLSFICHSESIRHSQIANHSRRVRRFLHHLDSIGIYIDSVVKTKLISVFVSKESQNIIIDNNSEESNCLPKKDDYFYE